MDSFECVETLESALEALERLHLKLQLEAGVLEPGSEVAKRLVDLTEETACLIQKLERVVSRNREKMSIPG